MKLTQRFGPIPVTTTLDGSGNGTVTFQPNGSSARITNLFVKVSTTTAQATCTIYKGQIADGNAINTTNSGSTGSAASGAIDLTDGEVLYVRWTGGDAGATATATFTGITIPFDQVGPSHLDWADPIAAGDGSLVYPALKSPNFVAGTSGWKIDRAGNAEFNAIDVRGNGIFGDPAGARIELTQAGDLEIYNAANTLIATIDETGIKYLASGNVAAWIDNIAISWYANDGAEIDLTTDAGFGAKIEMYPTTVVGVSIAPGLIYGTTFPAQNNAPVLALQSPWQSGRAYARIYIIGEDGAANPAKIDFRTGGGPVSVLDGSNLIVEGTVEADDGINVFALATMTPPASSASRVFQFNHSYALYVDNAGGGTAANRIWIDGPNGGECVIGPRVGASFFDSIRLRTSATTASAANCFIDASTQAIKRSTSSRKYKTNIENATFDRDALLALRPVTFHDRTEHTDQGDDARRYLGLIAEEVDALGLSELVQYDADGKPDGVQYDRLTLGLLTIVKDLTKRLSRIEGELR
jgi:hypothetical protein